MKQFIIMLVSIMLFLYPENGYATSWPYLSFDYLVAESDVILIGELEGNVESDLPEPMWQVDVKYYLKGDIKSGKIIATTPDVFLSDSGVKYVLLFLYSSEGRYISVTPSGVIRLHRSVGDFESDDNVTGKLILEQFNIDKEYVSESRRQEILSFIEQSEIKLPDAQNVTSMGLAIFLTICFTIVLVFKGRQLVKR